MSPSHSRHSSELLPGLLDELFLEILLRIPPDRPECLVRASLVSKPWRRALSDPAFCRRYRDFHRTPPMLGFFYNGYNRNEPSSFGGLISTTAFRPRYAPRLSWMVTNARYVRALFWDCEHRDMVVWDPLTDDQRRVPFPPAPAIPNCALLCATAGCDHSGCRSGPFLLLAFGYHHSTTTMTASVYSSEDGAWSERASIEHQEAFHLALPFRGNILVEGTVYIFSGTAIMGYIIHDRRLEVIDMPSGYQSSVLRKTEDGTLGFAGRQESNLHLWSRKAGCDGAMVWAQDRVIDLETVLPIRGLSSNPRVACFAEHTADIFISTDVGLFTIELGSDQVRKVSSKGDKCLIFPYTSFYTLDHETGRLPPP